MDTYDKSYWIPTKLENSNPITKLRAYLILWLREYGAMRKEYHAMTSIADINYIDTI